MINEYRKEGIWNNEVRLWLYNVEAKLYWVYSTFEHWWTWGDRDTAIDTLNLLNDNEARLPLIKNTSEDITENFIKAYEEMIYQTATL
jgi:hypothetical protein